MSRIGKQPITVPSGVEVTIDGSAVRVKGPKGQLEHHLVVDVLIERDGDAWNVTRADDSRSNRSLHGLQRTLIAN
ncbi:MAG: large subunit ribosomal protein, partial [Actinomycetota bacterium]|nr:large subunit ribosomal protein [Actinomycetota bacterium]